MGAAPFVIAGIVKSFCMSFLFSGVAPLIPSAAEELRAPRRCPAHGVSFEPDGGQREGTVSHKAENSPTCTMPDIVLSVRHFRSRHETSNDSVRATARQALFADAVMQSQHLMYVFLLRGEKVDETRLF